MTRVEQLWRVLNKRGIYTEQQLYSELKKRELDISIFTLKPGEQSNDNQTS